ncbi:MAG: SMI1/KNR4 family protein [Betaproteobacteria bacterium]|uniref:SMI1/KNR4 family protein n=1 Tax=Candidatus Proximibacter danicus TaxID=2954365 RepID=A0A9D7PRA3_9PROT|nr:SMI1/KNR4 family protein [Candidatus Proximibacter danicus]
MAWKQLARSSLRSEPGVTEDELRAFAAAINAPLPAEYVALYRWHNGQKMEIHTGPWYGLTFIPLTRVLSNGSLG